MGVINGWVDFYMRGLSRVILNAQTICALSFVKRHCLGSTGRGASDSFVVQ